MSPKTLAVNATASLPETTQVVIIGGGIVGISAALTLAERGIPVVVLEKGRVALEQSSRNLGWVRKTNRLAEDVPLSLAADKLWAAMPERTGMDVGYRQNGIMFIARTAEQMAKYEQWYHSVEHLNLPTNLITPAEIDDLVPGNHAKWVGGVYTESDGYAEPTLAAPAMANAAIQKGGVIVENCAARELVMSGGKISGVLTEKGEIQCEQVLLAGGLWARRFLKHHKIKLPTLPVICSVMRTAPMEGPTDIAVGAPDFSFRKHMDGGYIVTQRGKVEAPLTLDHLLVGTKYLPSLKTDRDSLCITFGKYFLQDLLIKRHWKGNQTSPFEEVRVMDPPTIDKLNQEALRALSASWPVFKGVKIEESWAGTIDITPDSNPVIDRIDAIPGLTLATGFSGHGFGTSPAAGYLAADLVSEHAPIVSPEPYRFSRL